MQQILLFPCEVCVPSDAFNSLFAPQARRPQSGYTVVHWDLNPDTDQITLETDRAEYTLEDVKNCDPLKCFALAHDIKVCHVIFNASMDLKVLSVLTRFMRQHLLQALGSVLIVSAEDLERLDDVSIRSGQISTAEVDSVSIEYPEFLDPQPEIPLPETTEHGENLIRKLAMKNKPGALRITLNEEGSQFEVEKLPRMTASKLADVMTGSRRPRFYLIRGLYSCALFGYLSRATREEKPQLAIQSHVKYIALCRAIRLIPGGGLRILRFVRYRHQVDVENLASILEEINLEVADRRHPVSLYAAKVPSYLEDLMSTYDAEETYIAELAHREFAPVALPQLSQPVIEPS